MTETIDTPLGQVDFTMTSADHVCLSSLKIVVNTVLYAITFHLHLIDGVWGYKDWHEPYLRRPNYAEPTPAARKKCREVLIKAWTEHLAAHPELSLAAERVKAQADVDHLYSEENDQYNKLSETRAKLRVALEYLASVKEKS